MKCTLFINGDLYDTSLLIAALASCESGGGRVSIVADRSISPSTPLLLVGNRVLAFDLRDQSYSICLEALERADIYFKRNYYEPHLQCLPVSHKNKIHPFGLNCPLKTSGSTAVVAKSLLRNPAFILQLRESLRTFVGLAKVETMERPCSVESEQLIHFQTRVWEPEEVDGDDFQEVNETRVALVRSLRREFGARFRGGLLPTPFARIYYPNEISSEPHVHTQHLKASRAALIGIYSRGLHHSLAFKLTEYLASSKCIVAEPLRNSLPVPLREGEQYLEFTTIDDCLGLCDRLLADPKAAQEMRAANWEYYTRHVRFDRVIPRCLEVCDLMMSRPLPEYARKCRPVAG